LADGVSAKTAGGVALRAAGILLGIVVPALVAAGFSLDPVATPGAATGQAGESAGGRIQDFFGNLGR